MYAHIFKNIVDVLFEQPQQQASIPIRSLSSDEVFYLYVVLFATCPLFLQSFKWIKNTLQAIELEHISTIAHLSVATVIFLCFPVYRAYISLYLNELNIDAMLMNSLFTLLFVHFVYALYKARGSIYFWIMFCWKLTASATIIISYLCLAVFALEAR